MKLSDFSESELARRLAGEGLVLHTGPFSVHVRTTISSVVQGLSILYRGYDVSPMSGYADFHVQLVAREGLRRWYKPQVRFLFDGFAPFKPLPLDQAFPMFEWGLNWCVANHMHNYLILHAAVIERDGYAVVLPAPPGSGKSTLCAALVTRGWRLLSDELTIVSLENGTVVPLPRPVGLKNHSIDVMKAFAPQCTVGNETRETNKGTVAHMRAPQQSVEQALTPARVGWVVFPKYQSGAPAQLEKLGKAGAFMQVVQNAFNFNVVGVKGFDALKRVIDDCACYEFSYGQLEQAMGVFDGLAANRMAAKPAQKTA